jgi:SAM-dependent methyltransferase
MTERAEEAFFADPFASVRDREPASHERMAGEPWDASYTRGPAPWDTGRPQPAITRLADAGGFAGSVLDVGCGTGENTLHIAALGLPVLGVDVAPTALAMARQKADAQGLKAEFAEVDALHLETLGRTFDTVLDCGLFHTFNEQEHPGYVASLGAAVSHGGMLHILCFSDDGPGTGPHPVRRETLTSAFNVVTGWEIDAVRRDRLQTRYHDDHGAPAWLVTITRIM